MSEKVSSYYKVPFRMVYCDTLWTWVKETIWCHVVLRAYPRATTSEHPDVLKG